MDNWHRPLTAAIVVVATFVLAKLADKALSRRELAPEVATRYRTVRRVVTTTILFIGIMSALLVIPQVRAIAGGILASSAVLGLVIGFAAQRTLGNAIAGILIAFSQPLRLGDNVIVDDVEGVVEEIGLTYTFIRTEEHDRFVIPNEKLASDTIRNLTIRSTEKVAEITVQIPLEQDLDRALDALRNETTGDVFVSELGEKTALITMREQASTLSDAEHAARELRVRAHRRLRAAGVFA
jgi:small-conductance mechanosensitive channel